MPFKQALLCHVIRHYPAFIHQAASLALSGPPGAAPRDSGSTTFGKFTVQFKGNLVATMVTEGLLAMLLDTLHSLLLEASRDPEAEHALSQESQEDGGDEEEEELAAADDEHANEVKPRPCAPSASLSLAASAPPSPTLHPLHLVQTAGALAALPLPRVDRGARRRRRRRAPAEQPDGD